jgi:hypothetical protein
VDRRLCGSDPRSRLVAHSSLACRHHRKGCTRQRAHAPARATATGYGTAAATSGGELSQQLLFRSNSLIARLSTRIYTSRLDCAPPSRRRRVVAHCVEIHCPWPAVNCSSRITPLLPDYPPRRVQVPALSTIRYQSLKCHFAGRALSLNHVRLARHSIMTYVERHSGDKPSK